MPPVPPPVPAVPDGLDPPELLEAPLEEEPLGAEEPDDADAPPEGVVVVAVVRVPVVLVVERLADVAPGTVKAGAGVVWAEVEPPPPHPATPTASARHGPTTARVRRRASS